METVHTTAKMLWKAATVAHGLERREMAETFEELGRPFEKGREFVTVELEPAAAELLRVVMETASTCCAG